MRRYFSFSLGQHEARSGANLRGSEENDSWQHAVKRCPLTAAFTQAISGAIADNYRISGV